MLLKSYQIFKINYLLVQHSVTKYKLVLLNNIELFFTISEGYCKKRIVPSPKIADELLKKI